MNDDKPKRARGKGCLVSSLLAGVLLVYAIWDLRGPIRRSEAVHELITVGKNLEYVENVMKEKAARHYIFYEIATNGTWRRNVKRDEFVQTFKGQADGAAPKTRVKLMFMGTAPGRAWFFVDFDKTGGVAAVSTLDGGD